MKCPFVIQCTLGIKAYAAAALIKEEITALVSCTLHASFPPVLKPAQIMFAVMFPLKDSLLLHRAADTMGTVTVLRVLGT